MHEIPMSTPIAARTLQFVRRDGSQIEIEVTLGTPVPDPTAPTETWACPYEIIGLGTPVRRATFGVDNMQALVFAVHILPAELTALARDHGGQFLDDADLGLGRVCRMIIDGAA
jgi:hypothetical protein